VILDRIVAHKRIEVEQNKASVPIDKLISRCDKPQRKRFSQSLRKPGEVTLIAEIKKASPSKGLIREAFDPVKIAEIYTTAGAAAISVLTDIEFFQGSPEYLQIIRKTTEIPLLRKDFIIDSYQIYEAKALGADAILLIMAILRDSEVESFMRIAGECGLECLVEVHTEEELKRALTLGANIVGINNRDLQTFKTDINTTFRLRELIIDEEITVVSESGINTRDDVLKLLEHQVDAMLVGEALMREKDIASKVLDLLGQTKASGRAL
jgi:indole-3-glycerol phosphate synthase